MRTWQRNLSLIWFTQILSLTGFGFALPFLPFYIQELGVTDDAQLRMWTGLISAAPAVTLGVLAPVWGVLSDRFGRKIMILRAMVAGTVILVLLAVARDVRTVFVLRLLQGVFTGTITAAAALVAAGTPRDKQATALGFLSSSTFIGYSLGPLLGGISAEIVGYRTTFVIGAAILFAGAVIVFALVRETQQSGGPEDAREVSFSWRALLSLSFVGLFILLFALRITRGIVGPFLPLYVQELRGSVRGASILVGAISAVAGLVTALSAVTLPRLGDRHDKWRLMTAFLGCGAACSVPLYFTHGLGGFIPLYVITIFFLGGVEPLLQSQLSAQTPPGRRGAVFGVIGLVGSAGWFFAPMAASAVTIHLSMNHLFALFSACIVLSVGVSAFLDRMLARRLSARDSGCHS